MHYSFPKDLANTVASRWTHLVSGSWAPPDLPQYLRLRAVLDACFVASLERDEGRHPRFNVLCVGDDELTRLGPRKFLFKNAKPLTASELRRVAFTTDFNKSAVILSTGGRRVQIVGVYDLTAGWGRALIGMNYIYNDPPRGLLVRVSGTGDLKVYQGPYAVAELKRGKIAPNAFEVPLLQGAQRRLERGLAALAPNLIRPQRESVRNWSGFELIAMTNVVFGLVNSIGALGHGGAVVLTSRPISASALRVKYPMKEGYYLRDSFTRFLNARHRFRDLEVQLSEEQQMDDAAFNVAYLRLRDRHEDLVESIRTVAQFSGCDGALVLGDDLELHGYGAEIRSDYGPGVRVHAVEGFPPKPSAKLLQLDSFGMRHRSAIKLCSNDENLCVFVVSQDGPVSLVWKEVTRVLVARDYRTVNPNMPWG